MVLPTNDEWELASRLLSDTLAFSKPISYSIEAYLRSDNPKYALSLIPDSAKSVNRLKKILSNYKRNDSIPSFILNREYPWYALIEDKLPRNVYFPEEFDVADKQYLPLNMIGNVAEMVSEEGATKGGSWRHNLAVSFPSKKIFVDANKAYD